MPASITRDFLIVAGSYERLLYGLAGTFEGSESSVSIPSLEPSFIYPAHISCIKALSANQRFLASGSTDEHVKLYDLKLRKEVGTLMHHTGSITSLAFYKRSHLLTGSEDGTIGIVRTSDWELLKTLTGHKYAVNSMHVHPSGKVLLSVGKEGTLKCWDLSRGICAYSMKLPKASDQVAWSPKGDYYAVLMDKEVHIHDVDSGKAVAQLKAPSRINAFAFTTLFGKDQAQVVVTGEESQKMTVWDLAGEQVAAWETNDGTRVKDMDSLVIEETTFITTCSTNGKIKCWDLKKMVQDASVPPVTQYDAKCRLTCVIMFPTLPPSSVTKKDEEDKVTAAYDSCLSEYEEERPKPVVSVTLEGEKATKKKPKGKKRKAKVQKAAEDAKLVKKDSE